MPAPVTQPEPPAPVEHQLEVDIPEREDSEEDSNISDSQDEGLNSDDDVEGGDVGVEPVGDADSSDAREGTAAPDVVRKRTGESC